VHLSTVIPPLDELPFYQNLSLYTFIFFSTISSLARAVGLALINLLEAMLNPLLCQPVITN
jgi:hypothetical protein